MNKKLLVLSLLALLVMPFASVNAQGVAESINYCEILPEADCQILLQSEAAMADVSSAAFNLSLMYDIAIDTDAPMENINFGVDGSGVVAFDKAAFNEMYELASTDMSAYMQQMPQLLDGVFAGLDGEMSLTVSLPEDMGVGMPSQLPLNLIMKDGVYAVNVAALEEALGEEPSGMTWTGINLNGAFSLIMEEMDFSEMFDNDAMGMMQGMQSADLTDAVSITRLADDTINGQSVAVFDVTLDYGVLLETMGMREMLVDMYGEMGIPADDVDMIINMLNDIELNMSQSIGLEDYYNYRTEFSMNFVMDGEMMNEPDMGTVTFAFDMMLEMSDFNTPVDVTIPEDAMIMPIEMLMGSGI